MIKILTLERSSGRRERLVEKFKTKNLPDYEFFPAFDGKDISNPTFRATITKGSGTGRQLRNTEIAITMSHLSAIKSAQVQKLPYVIILEDDVEVCDDFIPRLHWLLENLPEDWDYCYLAGHSDYYQIPVYEKKTLLKAPKMTGAFAYMVNAKAYSKVSQLCSSFTTTYDDMIMHGIHLNPKILNGYLALPFLAFHDAIDSTVWDIKPEDYKQNGGEHHSSFKYFRQKL